MGAIFKIPGVIIYLVAGLWGMFICLGIVIDHLGFIGGAIAFLLFPVTLVFAPWYEAIANANWFPVMLIYGGGICGSIFFAIGSIIDGD